MTKSTIEWKRGGGSDEHFLLERDGFTISYNGKIAENPFDIMAEMMSEKITSRVGGSETALIIPAPGEAFSRKFLILNGDFRKEYEKCSTVTEAEEVYQSLKGKHQSCFSDDHDLN
jgi:hypothetical protein